MRVVSGVALTATLLAGGALAERVADPFERHGPNYAIEGPKGHSEVFYVSVNYQGPNGEKRDDRPGDALLVVMGLGFTALVVNSGVRNVTDAPAAEPTPA